MTQRNYDKIVDLEMECVKSVAEETMLDAAAEIRQHVSNDDELFDTGVSCDGSWQKRGYSSLNGVVTAISIDTGKIIDCEAMSRICKACNLKQNLRKTDINAYNIWKATHVCKVASIQNRVNRVNSIESIQKRALRFLLDDDNSSYTELLSKSKISSMNVSRLKTLCTEIFKTLNGLNPTYLQDIFQKSLHGRPTRNRNQNNLIKPAVKFIQPRAFDLE